MPDYPHLAIPIRMENGQFVTNEQDSDEEAKTCVWAIISTQKGSRPEQPEFGINDPTFDTMPIDISDIMESIARWEPRVETDVSTQDGADGTQKVNIFVTMTGTSSEEA